jgi:hypothetical protein
VNGQTRNEGDRVVLGPDGAIEAVGAGLGCEALLFDLR